MLQAIHHTTEGNQQVYCPSEPTEPAASLCTWNFDMPERTMIAKVSPGWRCQSEVVAFVLVYICIRLSVVLCCGCWGRAVGIRLK